MEKLSKAQMKSAICCAPLARLLLRYKLPEKLKKHLLPLSLQEDDNSVSLFYERQLEKLAAELPANRIVPAACKRLAYHLGVFYRRAACNPISHRNFKRIIEALQSRAGFCYADADMKSLTDIEPASITLFDTGEVEIEYK